MFMLINTLSINELMNIFILVIFMLLYIYKGVVAFFVIFCGNLCRGLPITEMEEPRCRLY